MPYSLDAQTRLESLYDFAKSVTTAVSTYKQGYQRDGIPELKIGPSQASGSLKIALTDGEIHGDGAASTSFSDSTTQATTDAAGKAPIDYFVSVGRDAAAVDTGFADVALPSDFQAVIDNYENTLSMIDSESSGTSQVAGFAAWDQALATISADLTPGVISGFGGRLASMASEKYRVELRRSLAKAGISPMGKSDAGASGDGCWRDDPNAAFWWEIVGSSGGGYAPAFNNTLYYSSKFNESGRIANSTHEFALQLNIACPEELREGDTVTLVIGTAGFPSTYQVGDELDLPIVAAHDFYLAGGQDGDNIMHWNVTGTVSGPMALYNLDRGSPAPYSASGLAFLITPGLIDFALGDEFDFTIEGGHFKWRKNGGAWSSSVAINTSPISLSDGLSLQFTLGITPSFVVNDVFSFSALQPNSPAGLKSPNALAWRWSASAPTLVLDFGSVPTNPIDSVALSRLGLPANATATIQFGADGTTFDTPATPLALTFGVQAAVALPASVTKRYAKITLANAANGAIGWAYIGHGWGPALDGAIKPQASHRMLRGTSGIDPVAQFLGKAFAGDLEFSEGSLSESEIAELLAIVADAKAANDQPVVLIPNITRPGEAWLARVLNDDIKIDDLTDYQADTGVDRRGGAVLTMVGIPT